MTELKIDLENSHGIGLMNETFKSKDDTVLIYAPNGTMKSSLTKTIEDCIEGRDPQDDIYRERKSNAGIKFDGNRLTKANTYIFKTENIDASKSITTFLANKDLKSKYEQIKSELKDKEQALLKKIKEFAISTNCHDEIVATFSLSNQEDSFYEIIARNLDEIDRAPAPFTFKYSDVFDKKGYVEAFVNENKDALIKYFKAYRDLMQDSTFFTEGDESFGTYQADNLLKAVKDDRYFKARHKLALKTGETIEDQIQLKGIIDAEKNRIAEDQKLKEIFNELDKKLASKTELRNFQDVINRDKTLVSELYDLKNFNKKVLRSYLRGAKYECQELNDLYQVKKEEIKKIYETAQLDSQIWENVIGLFNNRFHVPFKVYVGNKTDMLLNTKTAVLALSFNDEETAKEETIDKSNLIRIMSTGEQRAFFLLQNIFEIEARKDATEKQLIVLDDIADSYDYKNKYAIIEYLADLKENPIFSLLILTHNFDFYRTVQSRIKTGCVRMAYRGKERKIEVKQGKYTQDIFKNILLSKLDDERCCLAMIPFARNIVEYTKGDNSNEYHLLTQCLHYQDRTSGIHIQDIFSAYKNIFKVSKTHIDYGNALYFDEIMAIAEKISDSDDEMSLPNKLILSTVCRLKSEQYMLNLLPLGTLELVCKDEQAGALVKRFKETFIGKDKEIKILEKVLMMTSENIHLNNFMFEPLVDVSILYLQDLYREVKENLVIQI